MLYIYIIDCSDIYFCSRYILVILKRLFSFLKSEKMNGKSGKNWCSFLGAVFRVLGSDLIIENALKNIEKWPENQKNMH